MKLDLRGHNERYVIEQSMLNLFPGETPVYGKIAEFDYQNNNYAIIISHESGENHEGHGENQVCRIFVKIACKNKTGISAFEGILSGDDYTREGRRRYWLGRCFFLAARKILESAPPWGMLSGVRPDKLAVRAFLSGKNESEIRNMLEENYFVSPDRAEMAARTGNTAFDAGQKLRERNICLYAGIPFCPTRCAYCSFVSQSVEKSSRFIAPYTDMLEREIQAGGELARDLGLQVRAFYMGGGTPTTLNPERMERILRAFENYFQISACEERTVEAGRPDTITEEKLNILKNYHITRISINPQSMDDRVLKAIGRRHTAKDTERAMNLAARVGFDVVNMDIIAGLPEDTPEGFARTLDVCLSFQPENLTVHTLALKKGSRILTDNLSVPDAAVVETMLDYAYGKLRAAGYAPYYLYRQKYMSGSFENTGWRVINKANTECLYNICEMSELCTVFALGAGGATKLVRNYFNADCDTNTRGRVEIKRLFNPKYPEDYLSRPEKWRSNLAAVSDFYKI